MHRQSLIAHGCLVAAMRTGTAAGPAAPRPNVRRKVSALVKHTAARPAPQEGGSYAPVLDALRRLFGAERLLFGSNWPMWSRQLAYADVCGERKTGNAPLLSFSRKKRSRTRRHSLLDWALAIAAALPYSIRRF